MDRIKQDMLQKEKTEMCYIVEAKDIKYLSQALSNLHLTLKTEKLKATDSSFERWQRYLSGRDSSTSDNFALSSLDT